MISTENGFIQFIVPLLFLSWSSLQRILSPSYLCHSSLVHLSHHYGVIRHSNPPVPQLCLFCSVCSRPQEPITKSLLKTAKSNNAKACRLFVCVQQYMGDAECKTPLALVAREYSTSLTDSLLSVLVLLISIIYWHCKRITLWATGVVSPAPVRPLQTMSSYCGLFVCF